MKVAVTVPSCFSACAFSRLGRPISTPCAIVFDNERFGSGRSFASRPISATLALPVAGSSGMFWWGANIRAPRFKFQDKSLRTLVRRLLRMAREVIEAERFLAANRLPLCRKKLSPLRLPGLLFLFGGFLDGFFGRLFR